MDFDCDIAIIGGGPAGSAAAMTLQKIHPDLKIILFEASQYEFFRPGETLSPPVTALLKDLTGLNLFGDDVIPSPGTRANWGGQLSENHFLFFTNGTGWHVRRERFDKMLADLARQADVRVVTGMALQAASRDETVHHPNQGSAHQPNQDSANRSHRRWRLSLKEQQSGNILSCRTTWVVDASGRKASFARRVGARLIKMDRLCSVMRIYDFHSSTSMEAASPHSDFFTGVESAADGWWYSSPIPGNQLIVAWMSDADLIKSQRMDQPHQWEEALAKAPSTFARIQGTIGTRIPPASISASTLVPPASDGRIPATGPIPAISDNWQAVGRPLHIHPSDTRFLSAFSGDHWIAAGDACYTVDPLSGQGILKAIRSGMVAAYAVADEWTDKGSGLAKFDLFTRTEFQVYLNQRWQFYREGITEISSLFWNRRTAPITLSPHAAISLPKFAPALANAATSLPHAPPSLPNLAIDSPLTPQESEQLLSCLREQPLTAAELIRKFQALEGQHASDERLVAGLQYLLQTATLAIVSPTS